MKISFGIIVLNGEPFTRYCIRALYPYAYEIIIAEGACEGARNVATPEGHSLDGTLAVLRDLKKQEDPENKITIVTAEDEGYVNGFWPGEKHEQSRAWAKRATGNYLWQVDIDEFYRDEDLKRIISILNEDPSVSCISFSQAGFWGGFNYKVDSWYLKRHLPEIFRIFKWGEGYQLVSHRPPTVTDNNNIDVRSGKWLKARDMKKMGIIMYHYSFVFPKQVFTKADYYSNSNWLSLQANDWATRNFIKITNPYRVFIMTGFPGWLEKFKGTHPLVIRQLIDDISVKTLTVEVRETADIEKLVNSWNYRSGVLFMKMAEPIDRLSLIFYRKLKSVYKRIKNVLK